MSIMLEQITGDTHDHANMKDGFETEFVCAGVLIFFSNVEMTIYTSIPQILIFFVKRKRIKRRGIV